MTWIKCGAKKYGIDVPDGYKVTITKSKEGADEAREDQMQEITVNVSYNIRKNEEKSVSIKTLKVNN